MHLQIEENELEIKNILAELDKHLEGTFLNLIKFNDSTIGACNISGESPIWEMHPDTDELFHIIEGEVQFTLLEETGNTKLVQVPYALSNTKLVQVPYLR